MSSRLMKALAMAAVAVVCVGGAVHGAERGKPQIVRGAAAFAEQLGELTGISTRQVYEAQKGASERIKKPGEVHWVKLGYKAIKFVGRASGPKGIVIVATLHWSKEAFEIEQEFKRGALTRGQANQKQAELATTTSVATVAGIAGWKAGTVVGTFLCPGPGTVVGGIVGGVGGYLGAEIMMAMTGLDEKLGEYLRPGVEAVRVAYESAKKKGVEVLVYANGKTVDAAVFLKDKAAYLKDKVVEGTGYATGKVVEGAGYVKDKTVGAAVLVKDKTVEAAVIVKAKTVSTATAVGDAVSHGAKWTLGQAKFGWGFVRRQFE